MYYGHEIWWDGRILLEFRDKAGNRLSPSPSSPHWNKHSKDWATYTSDFLVPEGAATLEITPALIRVQSGTLDLDDITLEPIPPEPVLEQQKAAAVKRDAEAAKQLAQVKAKVPVAPAEKLPPPLKVSGNHLETPWGKPVWLQGVAIPSLEWCEGGEHILASVEVAINDWKANCIRLPVTPKFWFGKGPYRHDGGAQYRQIVADAVNLCAAHGVYLVLDLHGFCAPTEADVAFWKDAAERYKNHPAVLFELFNEPYDTTWHVWRNGGLVQPPKQFADAPPEDQAQPPAYPAVGMQRLADTVRDTGAKNVLIAGGLDWGYDLSGVVKGYALVDRGGNGIMYSSHLYPWKKDWQAMTLDAAARYPIFVGEVGTPSDYGKCSFIPPEQRYPLEGWGEDVLGLIQKYQLNWTAWSFHAKAMPCLLSDDKYTPTPFWGVLAKDALSGKPFEMKKMR
jgi:hypothetical protein